MRSRQALFALLLRQAQADEQYRSRPDLAPPRLNITIPATSDVEQGYLFVAPFASHEDTAHSQHGPRQAGPYIFRDDGDLVWSGYGYYSIWATNFQVIQWRGKDVLACFEGDHNPYYGHGHGHVTLLDNHYETIRELRAGRHKISDKHEFQVVEGGETALIQIYQPEPWDLSAYGAAPDQQWIVNAIFQELNIATGEVLFEWSSLDHVSPDESKLPITKGQAGSGYNSSDAWDYYHINSVDKDRNGDYLLSARDACTVHKINGTDGSITWRLAGKRSDFSLGKGVDFCFQHHARWLQQYDDVEIISLYDNSAHGSEAGGGVLPTAPTSSGKILRLNTTSWTAELVQGYYPPDDLLSKSQGSTQVLPNRNVLVNWGSEGAMTEYLANGTVIFHAYMDSGDLGVGVQNYRAYRYNWTGIPNEEPAIVALEDEYATYVYVSWNGDTETAVWRFLSDTGAVGEEPRVLGDVKRTSFETVLSFSGKLVGGVSAVALDGAGSVIDITRVAKSQPDVLAKGFKPKSGLQAQQPLRAL